MLIYLIGNNMKIYSVFALLVIFTSSVLAQPKIEIVGGFAKNWGAVTPKDSPLKTNLVIKNVGTDPLLISKLKPSCGCTTAPLKKSELKPGESTDVEITFNVASNTGPVKKTITIETNDPNNAHINYLLQAEVVRPLTILPSSYMTFNTMQVGMEGKAQVKVKNTSNESITIMDPKTEPAEMKVNLNGKKKLKPGEEYELVVKVTPKKAGPLNTKLSFKTSSVDFPVVEIFGYGRVAESPIFNNK